MIIYVLFLLPLFCPTTIRIKRHVCERSCGEWACYVTGSDLLFNYSFIYSFIQWGSLAFICLLIVDSGVFYICPTTTTGREGRRRGKKGGSIWKGLVVCRCPLVGKGGTNLFPKAHTFYFAHDLNMDCTSFSSTFLTSVTNFIRPVLNVMLVLSILKEYTVMIYVLVAV